MKIVLSRKGFDSSAGGVPSPILPDGRLVSLPIPDRRSTVRYRDLRHDDIELGKLVHGLTRGRVRASSRAHLDPDLASAQKYSVDGLRASLGQCGSAAVHLANQGVGKGDVFLFFGWFREVRVSLSRDGTPQYVYCPGAPDLHVVFGWLMVDHVLPAGGPLPESLRDHPHCFGRRSLPNRFYLAAAEDALRLHNKIFPSAGLLPVARPPQVLTAGAGRRSLWSLPEWCFPRGTHIPFSYHGDFKRWRRVGETVLLASVARGQEFVLDTELFPEAEEWLALILGTEIPDKEVSQNHRSGIDLSSSLSRRKE